MDLNALLLRDGRERRMRRPSLDDEQRGQLADDVRRLAGFEDAMVDKATRLGAEVPEGVVACPMVWRALGGAAGGLSQKRRRPVIDLAHTASSLTG
jgi:hypothetical protein